MNCKCPICREEMIKLMIFSAKVFKCNPCKKYWKLDDEKLVYWNGKV